MCVGGGGTPRNVFKKCILRAEAFFNDKELWVNLKIDIGLNEGSLSIIEYMSDPLNGHSLIISLDTDGHQATQRLTRACPLSWPRETA